MALELELLSPGDKPALLGFSSPDLLAAAHTGLMELGYKVHIAENHEVFLERFGQFQYQVVIMEDTFGGVLPEQNVALTTLQWLPMAQRRHCVILLVGDFFETFNAMQAYQQSVHAVVNRADIDKLQLIIQQAVNEHYLFLSVFRDVQANIAQGKR